MIKDIVPSMFQRRLLLLAVLMCFATAAVGAQIIHLTVFEGRRLRAEAERVLVKRELIGTTRGTIFDRHQRILAEDQPCYDIAVDYQVICGHWPYEQAWRAARRDYRSEWGQFSFEQREAVIAQYRAPYDEQVERLWQTMMDLGGISRAELQRRRSTVISRVQAIRADVWDYQAQRRAAISDEPVELRDVASIVIREEIDSHTVLPAVSNEVAYAFMKIADDLPGLEVVESKTRRYPNRQIELSIDRSSLPSPMRSSESWHARVNDVGAFLVGTMREVWKEDVEAHPFYQDGESPDLHGYLAGDMTGLGGVEQSAEMRLRGQRGQKLTHRDTELQDRIKPQPGRDVTLTIDINLQARIRALMDPAFGLMRVQDWHGNPTLAPGDPLVGAVVVMGVEDADVLAMVSTPIEADPMYADPRLDPFVPQINRPIGAIYPPGSTLKPIVYAIAASQGVIGHDEVIDCRGFMDDATPNVLRCWGWRPDENKFYKHGPLGPVAAISQSCNIYFFTCGRMLGPIRLIEQLERWGFNGPSGLSLPGESFGSMPNLSGANPSGRGLTSGNATQIGIGQGPIAATPMQVAAAHVALAAGGQWRSPLLVREQVSQRQRRDLRIPPRVIDNALAGMWSSANEEHGTGHHLKIGDEHEPILTLPGVTVRVKTGTAQAPALRQMVERDDGLIVPTGPVIRTGNHSWFVAHVQRDGANRAEFIIVAIVEYGGSGGSVCGPLVNQVLYALRAEGYL